MGVYLIVIGVKDIQYRGIYHRASHKWMSSWTCTIIGSIAMLSSEVSIIILVFMSLERFLLIAVPLGGHKNLNWKTSCFSLGMIWIFGLSVAFIPGKITTADFVKPISKKKKKTLIKANESFQLFNGGTARDFMEQMECAFHYTWTILILPDGNFRLSYSLESIF